MDKNGTNAEGGEPTETRLERLKRILLNGKTAPNVRTAAAQQIAQIPSVADASACLAILNHLYPVAYRRGAGETRLAAAVGVAALLARFYNASQTCSIGDTASLAGFSVEAVLRDNAVLSASCGREYDTESSVNVSSSTVSVEVDVSKLSVRERAALRRKSRTNSIAQQQVDTAAAAEEKIASFEEMPLENVFDKVVCVTIPRLTHSNWEVRQGAAAVLRELLMACPGSVLPGSTLPVLLRVLVLERYSDFQGERVVVPIAESAAQILALLLPRLAVNIENQLGDLILECLTRLARSSVWNVQCAGLLALKYLFSVPSLQKLGRASTVTALIDALSPLLAHGDDDVRGSAADILAVLLGLADAPADRLDGVVRMVLDTLWEPDLQSLAEMPATLLSFVSLLHRVRLFGDDRVVPILCTLCFNQTPKLRALALDCLSRLDQNPGIRESDPRIRECAMQVLLLEDRLPILELARKILSIEGRNENIARFGPVISYPNTTPFPKGIFTFDFRRPSTIPFTPEHLVGFRGSDASLRPRDLYLRQRYYAACVLRPLEGAVRSSDPDSQLIAIWMGGQSEQVLDDLKGKVKVDVLSAARCCAWPESAASLQQCSLILAVTEESTSLFCQELFCSELARYFLALPPQKDQVGLLRGILEKRFAPKFFAALVKRNACILDSILEVLESDPERLVASLFPSLTPGLAVGPLAVTPLLDRLLGSPSTTTTQAALLALFTADFDSAIAHLITKHLLHGRRVDARLLELITSLSSIPKVAPYAPCLLVSMLPLISGSSLSSFSSGSSVQSAQVQSAQSVQVQGQVQGDLRARASACFGTLLQLATIDSALPASSSAELMEAAHKANAFLASFSASTAPIVEVPPIPGIQTTLRDYQVEGVRWLRFLHDHSLHGALCDDMGLGKTLQTICAIQSHYTSSSTTASSLSPSLIVCPSSLVGHWRSEILSHVKDGPTPVVFHGTPAERKLQSSAILQMRRTSTRPFIVITSYETVRGDPDGILEFGEWAYLVLDEGHIIRNAASKATLAVKRLPAAHRLLLSGTPIQNNVQDLWCLFDFLMPGFLGTEAEFKDAYGKPIAEIQKTGLVPVFSSSTNFSASTPPSNTKGTAALLQRLHRQVLPFILRRMKESVLKELPPKTIQNIIVPLSPPQRVLYDAYIDVVSSGSAALKGTLTGTEKVSRDELPPPHIFRTIQRLLALAIHPSLFSKDSSDAVVQRVLATCSTSADALRHWSASSKLTALKDLLLLNCGLDEASADVPAGHRVLIFAEHKSVLDLVENGLFKAPDAGLGHLRSLRYDSSLSWELRHSLVHRFNSDPSIHCMLLTTACGGLGLNLTGADTVIFLQHSWNPNVDLQAADRTHRIGQHRPVTVYRVLAEDTIEERVLGTQQIKLEMAATVVTQQNSKMSTMRTDSVLDLFDKEPPAAQKDDRKDSKKSRTVKELTEQLDDDDNADEIDVDDHKEYAHFLSIMQK